MNASLKKRLVRFVLYPAFFSLCFWVMLFVYFPYGALKDRISGVARDKGMDVRIGSLKPGFGKFSAEGVELGLFKAQEGKPPPEPVRIDRLELYPKLFPMGVHVRAKLLGGQLDAAVAKGKAGFKDVKVRGKSLQLSRLPPEALGNVIMDGEIALLADLTMDGQDFARTDGRVAVLGDALLVSKGVVKGFTIPRTDLGRLELDASLADGKIRLAMARLTGVDILATAEGDVKQARKLSASSPNVTLRFQPDEEFVKRNPMIKAALGFMSKDDEGYYAALLKGTFASMAFTPQRGKRK